MSKWTPKKENVTSIGKKSSNFPQKTFKPHWKKEFLNKQDKKTFFANLAKRRIRRIIRNKPYFRKKLSLYNQKLFKAKKGIRKAARFSYQVNIRIGPHNIFVNASGLRGKKRTYISETAGTYKVGISKKKLKHVYSLVLNRFYFNLKKIVKKRGVIFEVISPIKIRKKVVKTILHAFKQNWCIVNAISKKCFNGCRPPKKIRKKRQPRLRIFK